MAASNREQLDGVRLAWRKLFLRMFGGQPPGARTVPTVGFDEAMRALYGPDAAPEPPEPECTRESRPEMGHWA